MNKYDMIFHCDFSRDNKSNLTQAAMTSDLSHLIVSVNMIKAEFPHTAADTKHGAIIAVIKFTTGPPLLPAEAGLQASC